jgi:hypothetical protein
MKKFFSILITFAVMLTFGALAAFSCDLQTAIFAGTTLAAAPTLPTQKIVFLQSLKEEYKSIDTWLNAVEDLSSFVEDGQTLVFPEAGAAPVVYKNKTSDIDAVEPKETAHKEELDVYDSQNYKLRNVYLHALPYDKIQHYTKKSANSIMEKELADAYYNFAPESAGAKKIILPATGAAVGGFKTLILEDIIAFAKAADNAEFPEGASIRNLVLPSDMWWSLVNSNQILKGQLERAPLNGVINPVAVEYYGITIHKSLGNKYGLGWNASTNEKAPQGAAISGDICPAALFFCKNQVFKAGGSMEMFYQEKSSNTAGRAFEFGFQHRFKAGFQMNDQKYSGLIYLAKQGK